METADMRREKRRDLRHPVTWELRGKSLRPIEAGDHPDVRTGRDIHGVVTDISSGGLCLLTGDEADVSGPVRCEIVIPQFAVGIPTLLQVRWMRRDNVHQTNRMGLQFLV
jgi:hypothetical protein